MSSLSLPKKSDIALYIAVIYYIVFSFISDEAMMAKEWRFVYGIPWRAYMVCRVVIMAYAVFSIIEEEDTIRRAVFILLTILSFIGGWDIIFLMLALSGRSMKEWMQISLGAGLTMLGFTMVCAATGLIGISGHDGKHFAFGMVNRTNFAFAVLFFIISYTVIRSGRLMYHEYVSLYIIMIATYYHIRAKNAAVCMFAFVTLCMASQLYDRFFARSGINAFCGALQKYCLDYTFIWAYAVYRAVVYCRGYLRSLIPQIPKLRTFVYRLDVGNDMLRLPLTLFGRHINENGNRTGGKYYIIDSFFANTPVTKGILYFIVIMTIFTYFMIQARQKKDRTIYFAFMVMALFSITDVGVTSMAYNFIVALPFAIWDISRSPG